MKIWIYQSIICIDLDGSHYISYSYCSVRQYILSNILLNKCPKFDGMHCSYKTRCMFCCSFQHKNHVNNLKTETKSTIWIDQNILVFIINSFQKICNICTYYTFHYVTNQVHKTLRLRKNKLRFFLRLNFARR